MSGARLAMVLVTVLTLPSVRAGLIETVREPPPELRARWNRSGSAVCPDGYDYVARIHRCVARAVTAGAVPAQRNRRGSAVCPEGYSFRARYKDCSPR
jgi:hypothetical protein